MPTHSGFSGVLYYRGIAKSPYSRKQTNVRGIFRALLKRLRGER